MMIPKQDLLALARAVAARRKEEAMEKRKPEVGMRVCHEDGALGTVVAVDANININWDRGVLPRCLSRETREDSWWARGIILPIDAAAPPPQPAKQQYTLVDAANIVTSTHGIAGWVSRKEYEALKSELEALRERLRAFNGYEPEHFRMENADLRGCLDNACSRLAEMTLELGTLTRERDSSRKQLREANDKLARRGRL